MVPCKFNLDLPLFDLGPSSKGCGSNLWLLDTRISLFYWTLNLGPSYKVTLNTPQRKTGDLKLLPEDYVINDGGSSGIVWNSRQTTCVGNAFIDI